MRMRISAIFAGASQVYLHPLLLASLLLASSPVASADLIGFQLGLSAFRLGTHIQLMG